MGELVKDILGELIEGYETQVEGNIRIGFMENEIVIDPLISATIFNKKTNKNEFFITLTNQSRIKIGGLLIPIAIPKK
ncbi:MAG: hypothetical protein ACM3SR_16705 [Ignavibacteriales bacterium]